MKKITLNPEYHKKSSDTLTLIFKKKHIEIRCTIDNTGNTFKLPYYTLRQHTQND